MNHSEKPFSLKNSNKLFMERQKNIFDSLNNLPCNLQNEESMQVDETPTTKTTDQRSMKHFRGKESIFKRPQDPIRKNYMRNMPDFKKNPHKWKKYSLADVEDMSDTSNSRAAYSFLNQIKNRNDDDKQCDTMEEPRKIVFKKTYSIERCTNRTEEEIEARPSFRSSKVVMPEYVVGQKMKKERKNKSIKSCSEKQLKLDHLFEDD